MPYREKIRRLRDDIVPILDSIRVLSDEPSFETATQLAANACAAERHLFDALATCRLLAEIRVQRMKANPN